MAYDFESKIIDIPDYPKPGVIFKDVTPIFGDPEAFAAMIDAMAQEFAGKGITKVVGAEARGFLVGAPLALKMGAGFVPARKPGKLPRETVSESYALEYGTDSLHIHADAIGADDVVLVVDDLIATGGTAAAAVKMVKGMGAQVAGLAFLMELEFLNGRAAMAEVTDAEVFSIVKVG